MNTVKDTRYWIAVASRDHVRAGVAGGFAQANHGKRGPMARMRRGDKIIYYSSKETFNKPQPCQAFTAVGEVTDGEPYPAEMQDSCFTPYRRRVTYYASEEAPIKPWIDSLHFITNKQNWGVKFRQGFFEISGEDYALIARAMTSKEA